jgi:hypothetical protein
MTVSKKDIYKTLLLLAPTILALLLFSGYWLSRQEQASEDESDAPVRSNVAVEVAQGVTSLTVNQAAQQASGIETQPLALAPLPAGPSVYASVIDVQPLLDLAARHATASAELDAARVQLATSGAELERVRSLYREQQNVSLKTLGAAQAAQAQAAAQAHVAQANLTGLATALRQQFGPTLASLPQTRLRALSTGQAALARVVFGSATAPSALLLEADELAPVQATLVSAAPQTDPAVQGRPFFYQVAAPLALGTRLIGHLGAAGSGVRIPAQALVWYGGQPWAYVRRDATHFERRAVEQDAPADGGFVVTRGFKAGEQVVVRGAQLLLSEESRSLLIKD